MEKQRQPSIACKGIKKHYGENETRIDALRGIDLAVYPGMLTLMVGPSGCGKSTLLSIITNLLTADEGELHLLGHDINKMSEKEKTTFCRNHLGIVFQSLFLVPTLTVCENVSLPLLIGGVTQKEAIEKSMAILKKLRMDHRHNTSPANLSKGQQQRIAIARAIVNEAKIIVCDEPTSALDHATGMEVMNLLQELSKEDSKTVLVVTHDHRIFSYADRIIQMDDGKVVGEEHA